MEADFSVSQAVKALVFGVSGFDSRDGYRTGGRRSVFRLLSMRVVDFLSGGLVIHKVLM